MLWHFLVFCVLCVCVCTEFVCDMDALALTCLLCVCVCVCVCAGFVCDMDALALTCLLCVCVCVCVQGLFVVWMLWHLLVCSLSLCVCVCRGCVRYGCSGTSMNWSSVSVFLLVVCLHIERKRERRWGRGGRDWEGVDGGGCTPIHTHTHNVTCFVGNP